MTLFHPNNRCPHCWWLLEGRPFNCPHCGYALIPKTKTDNDPQTLPESDTNDKTD